MTVAARFRTLRRSLVPRWLSDGEGELVGYTLDILKDAFAERLRLGLLARFPQNGPNGETAPQDALVALGRDRRVERGFFEDDAAYALRLLRWLDDRKTAGSPFSMLKKIWEVTGGFACRTYDARGNSFSRASDGTESAVVSTWEWDDLPATQWSRFWVVLYPILSMSFVWTVPPSVGSGPSLGASTGTVGSTAKYNEAVAIRSIVDDWKPAGTICVNIIVALDAARFDPAAPEPDGNWGHWSTWNGTAESVSRLATARYWDGV